MKTMKKYLFFAAAITVMASCTSDTLVNGDSEYLVNGGDANQIVFSTSTAGQTRGDIAGSAAAGLLGNGFYVEGTKGTEPATSPTTTVVFDNYLVHYGVNTAGTTTSNTANWEYVGVTPSEGSYTNWVKLGTYGDQTIKYWDYSQPQYDFLAFSTGSFKAVSGTSNAANEIGVTKIATGTTLATAAYTFDVPSVDALKETYITDITEVLKANYGKEVTLKFKNLGSKVRMAIYETVPGYAVKDVNFYQWDGTTDFDTGTGKVKGTTAALISADANGFPNDATIQVSFPHIGVNNSPEATTPNSPKTDYDKASVTVTPVTANSQKWQEFGSLANFAADKEASSLADGSYIGRTLPTATFAGSADAKYYQQVFPVSSPSPITLRVDYTLVAIDGLGEEIHVYGAKAVVPSTYTKWLPNYAYTYIFKISDNTNGWTDPDASAEGLFPITFDAVVTEATDANAEQTTITTVAAPTITTYQQNHNANKNGNWISTDEYSIATAKDVYVQVMDNSTVTATLKGDLNGTTPTDATARSLFYKLSDADATEAMVMDALENRTTALNVDNVIGRNALTLTKNTNIDATVEEIVNGVDDNPISVVGGTAAKIAITASGFETGTYAYVYDYTTAAGGKSTTTIYQPIAVTLTPSALAIGTSGEKYCSITTTALDSESDVTAANEAVDKDYIYFSKTTNGTGTTTYSYVSVDGKSTLPAGLLKVATSKLTTNVDGTTVAVAGTFYFTNYIRNNGAYAVKVIKVVD